MLNKSVWNQTARLEFRRNSFDNFFEFMGGVVYNARMTLEASSLIKKNVTVYLSTPLTGQHTSMVIEAVVVEIAPNGFWLSMKNKDLVFLPNHKVDYMKAVL